MNAMTTTTKTNDKNAVLNFMSLTLSQQECAQANCKTTDGVENYIRTCYCDQSLMAD